MYSVSTISRRCLLFRGLLSLAGVLVCAIPGYAQSTQQKAWLMGQAESMHLQQSAEKEEADALALKLGIPFQQERNDGTVIEVQRVEHGLPIFYATQNAQEAQSIRTNKVWPGGGAGFSLTGQGVTVGIWDAGAIRKDHQELSGRVTQADNASKNNTHSTHVAGTLIGSGVDADARGMAYDARLQAYDWSGDRSEMARAAAQGLRVSNHSYGQLTGWVKNLKDDGRWGWLGDVSVSQREDYRFGYYDVLSMLWDGIAYNAPHYLILKAAGNDRGTGPPPGSEHWFIDRDLSQWVLSTDVREVDGGADGFDTIIDAGNAKNILTVGAVNDVLEDRLGPEDIQMTYFSGWGPTDDGRIKPDVVTDGTDVYSSVASSRTAYHASSGTSMAVASATGSVALLIEQERALRGDNPFLASTLKALVIHSADEAGPSAGPDYRYGWGLVNTLEAVQVMTQDADAGGNFNIREATVGAGDVIEWTVASDGKAPLRATISWTDPKGKPSNPTLNDRALKLVHNLDLEVEGPKGVVYYPWVLDPKHPEALATTGVNVRDNVEQVEVATAPPGLYTIRIRFKKSKSVTEDALQAVSLVATGIAEPVTKEVALHRGWNFIAFPVVAVDSRPATVLAKVLDDIVLIKDQGGREYDPATGVDGIATLHPLEAYMVYCRRPVTFSVEGSPLPEAVTIPLRPGWNLIPYLGEKAMSIEEAFQAIQADVLIVKDAEGNVYFPEKGVNTIGTVKPNHGYMAYIKRNTSLAYLPNP